MKESCAENTDPQKLVREGTRQDERMPAALDPAYAPVNEHTPAHVMVFARNYAARLKHFGPDNSEDGDWTPFFSRDVSAQLAVAAIEDIAPYKANLQSWFARLKMQQGDTALLQDTLSFLFGSAATLAQGIDVFKEGLPPELPLQGTLQNLIAGQLRPAFGRLIGYYKAGVARGLVSSPPLPDIHILQSPLVAFDKVLQAGLSADWMDASQSDWAAYVALFAADGAVYGDDNAAKSAQINHCAMHNLFRSVFDQFLKVYSRLVSEANKALQDTFDNWDQHEPHYALFLAFLRLFEHARTSTNGLTKRHLDFYYREILRLEEKSAEAGHAHLLIELAKQAQSCQFAKGERFKAGKDSAGKDAFFANDEDFVANQAKVAALKSLYRHGGGSQDSDTGRIFASPVANSSDGQGGALTSSDLSWPPFANKIYANEILQKIDMPKAEIGFAIASHYLLLAEGARTITIDFTVSGSLPSLNSSAGSNFSCSFTTAKGWFRASAPDVSVVSGMLRLKVDLGGDAPEITPYSAKTHGYNFDTGLPMLLVLLNNDDSRPYAYPLFQGVVITGISLAVEVANLKSLALSNDFGPVDTAKPFQPFGPSPLAGSALIVGSKELCQKTLRKLSIKMIWQNPPQTFNTSPQINLAFLGQGQWNPQKSVELTSSTQTDAPQFYYADSDATASVFAPLVLDEPDFSANEVYGTASRQGFVKLALSDDFGQADYQAALLSYLKNNTANSQNPGLPPVGPTAGELSLNYTAETTLDIGSSKNFEQRKGKFFHLAPFGTAEQHAFLKTSEPKIYDQQVYLLPQFKHQDSAAQGEFYVGISGLLPPQNISLLFQVADGTADPQSGQADLSWSYLKNNEWIGFDKNDVQDATNELLSSGIVTLAIPRDATNANTLLPAGLHWIKSAAASNCDGVCRLQLVAAQALKATFLDQGNAQDFQAAVLPAGTISKLAAPDSAVKSISQPYPSFGGRGAEKPEAFYTRISERLRHKDRALTLWDYERLILEKFPQIHKVKCLNHTFVENGKLRELAPGHVTVIAIPQIHGQRDPLKPYASQGLLVDIADHLQKRSGTFVKLHVQNPVFEEVRADFSVRFFAGSDEAYCKKQLQLAITRFLTPWAFADGGSPTFGGKIYKSVLINFIEDQPYVDYVIDFRLFHVLDTEIDKDEIAGSQANAILVSAPAEKHGINPIDPKLATHSGKACSCRS